MKLNALVILTNPDQSAMVEFPAADGASPRRMLVRNPIGAEAGDTVTVETESSHLLLTAFVLYILPLIAFAAGYLLGGTALWGAAAVVPAGVVGFLYNRRTRGNGYLTAVITDRAGEA